MASGWDVPTIPDAAPRFVLLGELASGGMGSIDLARMTDGLGERVVAMKRVHPQFSRDVEFVQMFHDEIWLTQGLSHPNVVQLIGWGEDDDGPYLVMELVDGAPLAEIAYQAKKVGRRLPDELVAFIAARVADGLHAAHTLTGDDGQPLGIVHRDITPSNVLVGFDGSIKITDFGIAKAAAKSSHTRTGVIKGKVEYMSPEHALRRPVDGRSDLYSLGVVLFEVLRGEPPVHGGSDLELLKRVAYEAIPPLASLVPDVDPEIAALIDRLVSKRPEDRPADGESVARELDRWLEARRLRPHRLQAKLAEHATRFGAARKRRLQKLMTAEGMELGSSSSWRDPKRVKSAGPPGPGTYERLSDAKGTRPIPIGDPSVDVRSGTRAVALPSGPGLAPPLPSSTELPSSRLSIDHVPLAERTGTRRVSTAPPAPIVARAIAPPELRSSWLPALAGVAVACVLVGFVLLVTLRAAPEPPAEDVVEIVPPPVVLQPVTKNESPIEAPAPEPAVPEPAEPPAPSASASAPPKKVPARPGQKRGSPGKVQTRRSTPCTPDRFDYPNCR